jgi:hypothetical protein
VQLILCKDNANERNESLLSNCRVQLIFCKDKAKNEKTQAGGTKSCPALTQHAAGALMSEMNKSGG